VPPDSLAQLALTHAQRPKGRGEGSQFMVTILGVNHECVPFRSGWRLGAASPGPGAPVAVEIQG